MVSEKLVRLLKEKALKKGEFTLASGKKSSYYVNLKWAYTEPEVLREIIKEIAKILKNEEYYRLAGVAVGAIPLAACTAMEVEKPYLIVRKDKKGHGTSQKVEGEFNRGEKVIILEDVTTTGGSVIEAVKSLKSQGIIVKKVVVVVDRQEGASENLRKKGIDLIPLIKVKEIL